MALTIRSQLSHGNVEWLRRKMPGCKDIHTQIKKINWIKAKVYHCTRHDMWFCVLLTIPNNFMNYGRIIYEMTHLVLINPTDPSQTAFDVLQRRWCAWGNAEGGRVNSLNDVLFKILEHFIRYFDIRKKSESCSILALYFWENKRSSYKFA